MALRPRFHATSGNGLNLCIVYLVARLARQYSGYVNRVDCGTAVAAFKNSKKWARYSAL